MAVFNSLTGISNLLAEKYGVQGIAAAERLQKWLEGAVPMGFPDVLARHLEEQHVPLLFDAFLAGASLWHRRAPRTGWLWARIDLTRPPWR